MNPNPVYSTVAAEQVYVKDLNREGLRFIPQLDSFRFFAVLLVMASHWAPYNKINTIPNGIIGVTFFFVLSGYLISANLLYLKRSIATKQMSMARAFKVFYLRRTLRIFPLYFLAILVIYLLCREVFMGNVLWYVFYLPNFLMFRENEWPGMLSHFWSLGVEEQFYLLWPLLIFLVKWERLKYLFAGMIVLSILFKLFFYLKASPAYRLSEVLPLSCFDAFGVGAILAYLTVSKSTTLLQLSGRLFVPGLITSIAIAILVFTTGKLFLFGLFLSAASFFIIAKAGVGFNGFAGWILNQRAIRYLGKISYGLYVYHNFMPWLWRCMTGKEDRYVLPFQISWFSSAWFTKPVVALGAEFFLLVLVASISWFVIEKPFNDLKRFVR